MLKNISDANVQFKLRLIINLNTIVTLLMPFSLLIP
jgi:hypothetical protein